MSEARIAQDQHWEGAEISAYLDGELSTSETQALEFHLKSCKECTDELLRQRQTLCTLDLTLDQLPSIELPRNFAQVVTASAQTDMHGVRSRSEYTLAVRLFLILGISTLTLLSLIKTENVLLTLNGLYRLTLSLLGLIYSMLMGAGAGLSVVLRAIGRYLIYELHSMPLSASLFFAIAATLLPLLIISYHRYRITNLRE
jgi:anti-sigma factor RsiW